MPGGISEGKPEPAFSPASRFGKMNSPFDIGTMTPCPTTSERRRGVPGGRSDVVVLDALAYLQIVGSDHDLNAGICPASSLQALVHVHARQEADSQSEKSNHQQTCPIHANSFKLPTNCHDHGKSVVCLSNADASSLLFPAKFCY
jgi:hypothetical protein